jgi:hypothetical protein
VSHQCQVEGLIHLDELSALLYRRDRAATSPTLLLCVLSKASVVGVIDVKAILFNRFIQKEKKLRTSLLCYISARRSLLCVWFYCLYSVNT